MKTPSDHDFQKSAVDLVLALLQELASEIDLHYETADRPSLLEPLTKLRWGAAFLTDMAIPVPGVVNHVLSRFRPELASV
jgi:hypothetical protein